MVNEKEIEELEAYVEQIPHAHDRIFKDIFEKDPEAALKVLGFDFGFKEFLRNEFVDDIYKKAMMDMVFICREGYGRIVEIQKGGVDRDDLLRFMGYQVAMQRKWGVEFFIYIVSLDKVLINPIIFKNKQGSRFTIDTVSLTLFDSNKALNRINNKIKLNGDFNREDVVEFKILHYMETGSKQKELLRKCIGLTPKIKNLSKEDQKAIKTIQTVLAIDLFKDKKELSEIIGEINMEFNLEKLALAAHIAGIRKIAELEGEEKGIKIGEEKGIKIGEEKGRKDREEEMRYEFAKELINDGVPPNKISKWTHLNMTIINSMILANDENQKPL